ncbi:hypothetical protein Ahy_B02g060731 [Arachis hypogaea]|uniref:ATP-dependent DNA helicase n=1 Tax=Arachis hypogaea TaxID=3818 RepID=A0A445AJ51_ARAHY|nr:hypothetical protein Ahy_B02g060731 [Arachis hypogaea]
MIESARLNYIRFNQEKFRCEIYKGIKEAVLSGETAPSSRGKHIILPSSFIGGPRYMIQKYFNAMAICKVVGYPDLFITFTYNPKWPELKESLRNRELNVEDRLDMSLSNRYKALICTIEFKKRGLPYAHMLLFLHRDGKYPTAEDIDKIISAEILDNKTDPEYYEAYYYDNLRLTDDELKELTLIDIELILKGYHKSLTYFESMAHSNFDSCTSQMMFNRVDRLTCDELHYDRRRLAEEHSTGLDQMTTEHRLAYDKIMEAVHGYSGGVFFLYGYSGTEKTFVWKTLASALRSKGQIVLTVTSSGIASLLILGDRTAHSRFAIPLNVDEFSTCNIK